MCVLRQFESYETNELGGLYSRCREANNREVAVRAYPPTIRNVKIYGARVGAAARRGVINNRC
jgi:hypothetical protein